MHSTFRGSVNCGAPLIEDKFQVTKFLSCPNGPGVTWVACISLSKRSKWSLGCARALLEAFLDIL